MLLLEGRLKCFSVKFRKEMKKMELVHSGMIKEGDDLCVRMLLFLLCIKPKDLERIEMDFFRSSVNEYIDDEAVLDVLYYLQEKNILEYNYERAEIADDKGVNMDKITNLIGNISLNISNMSDEEYKESKVTEEQREFEKIYRLGLGSVNANQAGFTKADESKEDNKNKENKEIEKIKDKTYESPKIIENTNEEETVKFKKIESMKDESIYRTDLTDLVINTHSEIDLKIDLDENDIEITLEMVCDELENNINFRDLYNEVQQKLKAIINPNELEVLYNLYNRMESELLLKIAEFCGENVENPQTIVYNFERTALNLSDNGVKTLEQYLTHLKNAQTASDYEIKIRKIFGFGDNKKLTAKERQYIRAWALEYKFSDEMIIEGYTKALDKGKATIPYINAIYSGWHEKGFTNVDEVREEFNTNGKKVSRAKQKPKPDFDSEQFFEKLVRKSMKF